MAALFYGVRLWAAVCLALFVAFWLELDDPYWAGATAAVVFQPVLGASLRKAWFRLIGTVMGAIAAVVLESMQSCGVHYAANATASSPFAGRKPG